MGDKISKLIDVFKGIIFIFKLIFWVSIIILSLGGALLFLPENLEDEYKDDWELMDDWLKKQESMHEGK